MKLYHAPASPFVRKVMILLREAGASDRVTLVPALGNPLDPGTLPIDRWALADLASIRAATDPKEKIREGQPYRRLELVWKTGAPPFPLQGAYQRPQRGQSGARAPLETLASAVNSWLNRKR